MLTLAEIQTKLRDAIIDEPDDSLLAEIVPDRVSPRDRVDIHRNHFQASLASALIEVYPATRRLLGERYFDAEARRFCSVHPPDDPRVRAFGGGLPAYLATRIALGIYGYTAEVARFEWAIAEILDAADAPPLGAGDAANSFERAIGLCGEALVLELAPSVMRFHSAWPVQRIRREVLAGAGAEAIAALLAAPTPARLLLYRDADGDPCELVLDEAGYAAAGVLLAGFSAAEAARVAATIDAGFTVGELIRFLFEAGLIAGVSVLPALNDT